MHEIEGQIIRDTLRRDISDLTEEIRNGITRDSDSEDQSSVLDDLSVIDVTMLCQLMLHHGFIVPIPKCPKFENTRLYKLREMASEDRNN